MGYLKKANLRKNIESKDFAILSKNNKLDDESSICRIIFKVKKQYKRRISFGFEGF